MEKLISLNILKNGDDIWNLQKVTVTYVQT